mmetsp:Transcript_16651/g.51648  ORF Transcript_16651/g.51648 Transcript_16651/m.51648 type:complete len:298 (-) Transcript_16651:521-1414(-)
MLLFVASAVGTPPSPWAFSYCSSRSRFHPRSRIIVTTAAILPTSSSIAAIMMITSRRTASRMLLGTTDTDRPQTRARVVDAMASSQLAGAHRYGLSTATMTAMISAARHVRPYCASQLSSASNGIAAHRPNRSGRRTWIAPARCRMSLLAASALDSFEALFAGSSGISIADPGGRSAVKVADAGRSCEKHAPKLFCVKAGDQKPTGHVKYAPRPAAGPEPSQRSCRRKRPRTTRLPTMCSGAMRRLPTKAATVSITIVAISPNARSVIIISGRRTSRSAATIMPCDSARKMASGTFG